MNLDLTEDQSLLVTSLRSIVSRHLELPAARRRDYAYYSHQLDADLDANGFLQAAVTPGMGALEAALVVEEASRAPCAVETGASALVAPHITEMTLARPITLL